VSDLKLDHQRRDLHKSNLPATSRKIRPVLIDNDASARFFGGLNHDIQNILDYKEWRNFS
jgi:hypothetical protein